MDKTDFKPQNISEYISAQPAEIQPLLQKIRETVLQAVPEAVEVISYAMPAFKFKGKILLYFASFKNHIGFYATPSANVFFADDLKDYNTSKGTIQFPYTKEIPYDLIVKIAQFKANELSVVKSKKNN